MNRFKRTLSIVLSVAMVLQLGFTPAFASEGIALGTSAVCPHHVHDESCGYAEGTPCGHEHTDECYQEVTTCIHEHTDACYPADEDAVSESATPSDAPEKEPTSCTHTCDEENGCVTREPDCKHVHDADCGYTEAAPCTFDPADCALCTPADSGTAAQVVTGFVALDYKTEFQSVPAGTARAALDLPDTLIAHLEGVEGAQSVTGVTWAEDAQRSDPAVYDEAAESGAYVFTPVLPEGCTLAEGVSLPEVKVMVEARAAAMSAGYDIALGSVTITGDDGCSADAPHSIIGESTSNTVTVNGGTHHITLNGVSIDINGGTAFEIKDSGTVYLTLVGNNVLKSGDERAGLQLQAAETLMITAASTGTLIATGMGGGAGIGGGKAQDCGTVTINGGIITATNGGGGAGIGGGVYNSVLGGGGGGGTVTVNGDAVVFAAPHIGNGGNGGSGGVVYRTKGLIFEGDTGKVYGNVTLPADVEIPSGKVLYMNTGERLTVPAGKTLTINGVIYTAESGNIVKHGSIVGEANIRSLFTVDVSNGSITLSGSDGCSAGKQHVITGITTSNRIVVESGTHHITLNGVDINVSGNPFYIKPGAEVNLILQNDNKLNSRESGGAGLYVPQGATLVITAASTGTLIATGANAGFGNYCAGIGGVGTTGGGTITINGGIITATGSAGPAAGIGGGGSERGITDSGNITINGNAVVFAKSGQSNTEHIGNGGNGASDNPSTTVYRTKGVIFEGDVGKVYGNVTLQGNVEVPADKTLTIEAGRSLTIPSGFTLTNSGAIISQGTLMNNGTFTNTGTATGTGYGGTGTVTATLAESLIKLPSNLVYNGTAKEITVAIFDHVFAPATDYTVAYSPNNIDEGEVTATVTSVSGGKLTGTPVEKKFTITQSGTAFTGGITTDKADKTYTYGETITVTVTPKATGAAPAARRAAPTAEQMALFLDDTQISDALDAVNGTYTMTIATKDKTLAVGNNTITAKYVGTASMADYSETVTVTLLPKAISSAEVNAGTTKVYDGTDAFTGVALTLNAGDILSGDIVTATAAGDAAGANVDTHSFTATGVTLSSAQSSYYSLAASEVSGNVGITKAPLIVTGGTVTQREYDGTIAATVTALTFSGLQSGEALAMTTDYTVGTPVYNSADAGTSKTVTGTAALIANDKTNNYSLTGGYTITGQTIDKNTGIAAPTGVTMDDTTTAKSFTFGTVSGYADVTAYEWRLHTHAAWTAVSANPITFGNRAGNIEIRVKETANYAAGEIYTHGTAFTATLEGSVSISGTAAYGETLTAIPTGCQTGAVLHYTWKTSAGSIGTDSATLAIPDAAVGKTITVEVTADGYTGKLTGAATAAVAPAQVTATAGAISKVYDGTNAVEAADRTLTIGKVNPGDDITVTMPSAAYDSKNTGSGKPITVGDLAITGAAKDWYTVTAPTGVTGEITAKPLTAATVTVNGSYTYNGTAQTPAAADVAVMDGTTTLTNGTDYTYTATNHTNAGTAAVNVTFQGNYSGTASGTFAIGKAPLTIAGYTAEDKDYDGKTDATVSAVTFTGLQNSESLALTADYTVSASFETKDAGTGIAVSGTATLTNSDKAKNYSLASGALSGQSADITAIDPSYNVAAQKIKIENSLTAVQRLQSATGVSNETVEGALTWSETSGGAALDDTFTFEGSAGDVITLYWTFAPTSGNYKALSDSTAFTLTTKDVPILTVNNISKTYDGTAVTTVSGTAAKADGTGIPGTFAFGSAPLMKDAGTYNAVVNFTPTDTASYETAAIGITVTINKATITIKAKDKSAFVGDAVPTFSDADYTVSGLVSGETLETKPALTYVSTPDMSQAGSVAIIASGAAAPDGGNYNDIVYQLGTLTISTKGGGSTGGGSSSSGSSTIITPAPTHENPTPPTTVETKVSSKTDQNGNAAATVPGQDITGAIKTAQDAAKKSGTEKNGIAITINVSTDQNASSLGVTLPQKSVSELVAANVTAVTVKSGLTSVTFDLATLKSMTGGDVVLTSAKAGGATLSTEAQAAIGNRPVYRFTVTVGGKTVTNFGGQVAIAIPYTPAANEKPGNLYGVYVDDSGKVTWLTNSSYDSNARVLRFSTSHFSVFGVGYKESTAFADVGTHWAKDDIAFVVSRGMLTGTGSTTFSPDTSMTRGMFVTALGRLAGVDTATYGNTKFTDVAATAYYAPYVAWANANGIVNGTSATTFSPDKAISRQEMAVMLVNYSKAIGYELPKVHAENTFADAGSIGAWAKDAVKQMQMAGVLMGKSGNKFDPTATRAEVSAMLRRFVELVISSDTAEGWAMNDSGQWMYFENGKPVTGEKTIDGTKYIFNQNGVTADLPKN